MKVTLLLAVLVTFLMVKTVEVKKTVDDNLDPIPAETKQHGSQKYSKEFQKSHHHNHKHKKTIAPEEQVKEEPKPKSGPVDVPEPDIQLQENIHTSKKAVEERKRKENTEDLHLQDLAYEESLKKEKNKKKRGGHHHGAHQAEILKKDDKKLFAEHEAKKVANEKVIEDSFEPLKNTEKKNKKSKSKGKKAFDKNKDKSSKKSKEGKHKNKDKKHKNKDKKNW